MSSKHGGGFPSKREASADQLRRKIIRALLKRLEITKEEIILEGLMNKAQKRLEHIKALDAEIKGEPFLEVEQDQEEGETVARGDTNVHGFVVA